MTEETLTLSLTEDERHELLVKWTGSIRHCRSAGQRGDLAACHHHKGYRKGMEDALLILGIPKNEIQAIKEQAFDLSIREGPLPTPPWVVRRRHDPDEAVCVLHGAADPAVLSASQ